MAFESIDYRFLADPHRVRSTYLVADVNTEVALLLLLLTSTLCFVAL
jgi:hypothetical protein